jgi:TetR/AcrR family tetracycline transcriptional repressor
MSQPSPKSTRRPARTSVAEAVEAGVGIIDKHGLEALTIRRLAQELGIGAMTLYSYFSTKDALLDCIAERLFGDIKRQIPAHGSWKTRLTKAMSQLQLTLREHPGAAALSLSRRGPLPALDPFRETILTILHDAGFPVRDAVNALTALIFYVTGDTIIEHARTQLQIDKERARLAKLPGAEFPHLAAAADLYADHVSQGAFDTGLKNLINGLALQLSDLQSKRPKIVAVLE